MKIEKTVCPYCGANMKILPGQVHAECEYCGSSVVISGLESEGRKERPSVDLHPSEQRYEEHTATGPARHAIFSAAGIPQQKYPAYDHCSMRISVHPVCCIRPGKCLRLYLFYGSVAVSDRYIHGLDRVMVALKGNS